MQTKVIFWILFFTQIFIQKTMAQNEIFTEQAKFVYNFTREIEWPAGLKSGPFIITIYGSDDLFNNLERYTLNKTVVNQPILLKNAKLQSEIRPCHILFISNSRENELSSILQKLKGSNTLVITDQKEGILKGAGISFVEINHRLCYEINTESILKAGLRFSSDLVDLAIDIPIARH